MALTYTPPGELGSKCPGFSLPGVDGKIYSHKEFAHSDVLVVMFICNHCPYVQAVEDRIIALAKSYPPSRVQFIGICSNDSSEYPDDAPGELHRRWQNKNYGFPYLVDETQETAKAFQAVCTPDFFVYDQERKLVYRGRLDDSWKDPKTVTKSELRENIDRVLGGDSILGPQHPSMGCSIKWKSL